MKIKTIQYLKTIFLFEMRRKYLEKNKVNAQLWKHKFKQLLSSDDSRYDELLWEFLFCDIKKISKNKIKKKNRTSPILFCVIKNDVDKIQKFMQHYRKLGVECFVFLDNNSTDGTREYLCNQKDAIVFLCTEEYSSARRVAWLNRLLAVYGDNQWCLVVDSDELITYIDCEKYSLCDVVKKAIENQYFRIEGFMLDMYSTEDLFKENDQEEFTDFYRYFDANSYEIKGTNRGIAIWGGPRKRVFRRNMKLSKYPLFYYREEDFLASSHYMIPFQDARKCPIWFAICHYKFLNKKDLEKIEEAVKKENYAAGSMDYKIYLGLIKKKQKLSFFCKENSREMKNSVSLKEIKFIKSIF